MIQKMRSSGEAPKIVQIETRYVETDAYNFRDVVQSLTGKNSSTAWIGRSNNADGASSSTMAKSGSNSSLIKTAGTAVSAIKPQEGQDAGAAAATSYNSSGSTKEGDLVVPNSMLTNNMAFKDFDRLLLEMPITGGIEGLPWF